MAYKKKEYKTEEVIEYTIYLLRDPGEADKNYLHAYIGSTMYKNARHGQHKRFHKSDKNSHLKNWLKKLNNENREPEMIILDSVMDSTDSKKANKAWALECAWYDRYEDRGHKMINDFRPHLKRGGRTSDESRKRATDKIRGEKHYLYGKKRDRTIVQKAADGISKATKKKSILQFDINGHFIREWNSSENIKKELNIAVTHVLRCCRGKGSSAQGFVWKYKIDFETIPEKIEVVIAKRGGNKRKNLRQIAEYTIDGEFINVYQDVYDVLEHHPEIKHKSCIYDACANKLCLHNCRYVYIDKDGKGNNIIPSQLPPLQKGRSTWRDDLTKKY